MHLLTLGTLGDVNLDSKRIVCGTTSEYGKYQNHFNRRNRFTLGLQFYLEISNFEG